MRSVMILIGKWLRGRTRVGDTLGFTIGQKHFTIVRDE